MLTVLANHFYVPLFAVITNDFFPVIFYFKAKNDKSLFSVETVLYTYNWDIFWKLQKKWLIFFKFCDIIW